MPDHGALGDAFDVVVGGLDPPMVVVTTAVGDDRAGCLVGFHTQCSIEPPRYSVWLSKANHTVGVARRAEHLAVHFLTKDDRDLAELFGTTTGTEIDKFTRCDWRPGPDGVPLLDRCPNRFVIRLTGVLDEGSDHLCFAGEPIEISGPGGFEPLRLADVDDLEPGHEPDDRPPSD